MDAWNLFIDWRKREFEEYEKYLFGKNSKTVKLVSGIQDMLMVYVDRMTGVIVDRDVAGGKFHPVTLIFQLNHEVLEVDNIFFDEKQIICRLSNKDLRRVGVNTIKAIRHRERVLTL